VVAAGDYASIHRGLEELIDMLVVIEPPTVVVPGNNETEEVCVPRAPAGALPASFTATAPKGTVCRSSDLEAAFL
jgi:hypothetical protein